MGQRRRGMRQRHRAHVADVTERMGDLDPRQRTGLGRVDTVAPAGTGLAAVPAAVRAQGCRFRSELVRARSRLGRMVVTTRFSGRDRSRRLGGRRRMHVALRARHHVHRRGSAARPIEDECEAQQHAQENGPETHPGYFTFAAGECAFITRLRGSEAPRAARPRTCASAVAGGPEAHGPRNSRTSPMTRSVSSACPKLPLRSSMTNRACGQCSLNSHWSFG